MPIKGNERKTFSKKKELIYAFILKIVTFAAN